LHYNELYLAGRTDAMNTQLTVRLPDHLEKDIAIIARKLGLKRSDIVRIALERFVRQTEGAEESSPYEKVKGLLGIVSSGISDLGESHRAHLLKKFKRDA
jgi:metal-responsive CopG/Arc/MetJ family transcriptional regulator